MEKENSEIKELLKDKDAKAKKKNNKKKKDAKAKIKNTNANKDTSVKDRDDKAIEKDAEVKEKDAKAIEKEIEIKEKDTDEKNTTKIRFNTVLDQLILISGSVLLTLIIDYSLPLIGYQLKNDIGASYLFTLVIYFIANCIYGPIAQRKREKKLLQK